MIGGVISVFICIWFYRTADRLKLNPCKRSLPPGNAGILPASWGCGHPGRRAGETPALPGG
jgi:hypothetical protein